MSHVYAYLVICIAFVILLKLCFCRLIRTTPNMIYFWFISVVVYYECHYSIILVHAIYNRCRFVERMLELPFI